MTILQRGGEIFADHSGMAFRKYNRLSGITVQLCYYYPSYLLLPCFAARKPTPEALPKQRRTRAEGETKEVTAIILLQPNQFATSSTNAQWLIG